LINEVRDRRENAWLLHYTARENQIRNGVRGNDRAHIDTKELHENQMRNVT